MYNTVQTVDNTPMYNTGDNIPTINIDQTYSAVDSNQSTDIDQSTPDYIELSDNNVSPSAPTSTNYESIIV